MPLRERLWLVRIRSVPCVASFGAPTARPSRGGRPSPARSRARAPGPAFASGGASRRRESALLLGADLDLRRDLVCRPLGGALDGAPARLLAVDLRGADDDQAD